MDSLGKVVCTKEIWGIGFKKHDFNIAMLGKQAWRLTMDNFSLVSRIFIAHYYHSTTFLEADIGLNSSYIWRSILTAQQIVKAGYRVGIRDGKSTNIWNMA